MSAEAPSDDRPFAAALEEAHAKLAAKAGAGKLVTFTEEDLVAFQAKAKAWMAAGPDKLGEDTIEEMLVQSEILARLIREPPPGRPGLVMLAKAIPLFREHRAIALGALYKRAAKQLPQKTEETVDAEVVTRPHGKPARRKPGRPAGHRNSGRGPGLAPVAAPAVEA